MRRRLALDWLHLPAGISLGSVLVSLMFPLRDARKALVYLAGTCYIRPWPSSIYRYGADPYGPGHHFRRAVFG